MRYFGKKLLLPLTLSFTLSACVSMSNYPETRVQQLLGTELSSNAQALENEDIGWSLEKESAPDWWAVYQDQALNHWVQVALERNVDLKLAGLNEKRAGYALSLNRVGFLPTLSARGGASKSQAHAITSNSYSADVALSWSPDLTGRLAASSKAAYFETQLAMLNTKLQQEVVAKQAVALYFKLAYLIEAIGLEKKVLERVEQLAAIANSQAVHGLLDKAQRKAAQLQVAEAKAELANTRADYQETLKNARNIMHLAPNEPLTLPAVKLSEPPRLPDLSNIPLTAILKRNDMKAAYFALQKAAAQEQGVWRSFLPNISLSTAIQFAARQFVSLWQSPAQLLAASVSLPFLDWSHFYWQNQEAKTNFEAAKWQFDKALTLALNEIDSLKAPYFAAYEQASAAVDALAAADVARDKEAARYRVGVAALRDYLLAENQAASARRSKLAAQYQLLLQVASIYQALGSNRLPAAAEKVAKSPGAPSVQPVTLAVP